LSCGFGRACASCLLGCLLKAVDIRPPDLIHETASDQRLDVIFDVAFVEMRA
jgi:hypothetical protein